ncbi:MAG TPA: hypothetical protein V6D26_01795 [Stenomitos sp.]
MVLPTFLPKVREFISQYCSVKEGYPLRQAGGAGEVGEAGEEKIGLSE